MNSKQFKMLRRHRLKIIAHNKNLHRILRHIIDLYRDARKKYANLETSLFKNFLNCLDEFTKKANYNKIKLKQKGLINSLIKLNIECVDLILEHKYNESNKLYNLKKSVDIKIQSCVIPLSFMKYRLNKKLNKILNK